MKKLRNLTAIILTFVMLIGVIALMPVTAFADEIDDGKIYVGEEKTVTFETEGEYRYFTFTPNEDGMYAFYSSVTAGTGSGGSNIDPAGYFYDVDTIVGFDDDRRVFENNPYNFYAVARLEKGKTYRLMSYIRNNIAAITLGLKKLSPVDNGVLSFGAEYTVSVSGDGVYTYSFTPEESTKYTIITTDTDNAVITVSYDNLGQNFFSGKEDTVTTLDLYSGQNYTVCVFTLDQKTDGSIKLAIYKNEKIDLGEIAVGETVTFNRNSFNQTGSIVFNCNKTQYYYIDVTSGAFKHLMIYRLSNGYVVYNSENRDETHCFGSVKLESGESYEFILFGSTNQAQDTMTLTLNEHNFKDCGEIAVSEEKTFTAERFTEGCYTFTPDETGVYAFYSLPSFMSDSSFTTYDTIGFVRSAEDLMTEIYCYDDDGGRDFCTKCVLEGGTTYILSARYYNPIDYTGEITVKLEKIDSEEHVHGYATEITEPTCTAFGYTTHICQSCGYRYIDGYTSALGHNYGTVTVDPTCTEQGYTRHICSRCSDEYKDGYTDALGHDHYVAEEVEPTCTEAGWKITKCTRCDDEIREDFDALGHDLGEWVVTKEATYEEDGERVKTCSRCGETVETQVIPKLVENGWYNDNGNWYYFNKKVPLTSWAKIGGKWYFFNSDGVMKTGWQKISKKWYYFDANGVLQTGWQKIAKKWYYFDANGAMQTGWQSISNKWYYFNKSGVMLTGWRKISSKWYYFNKSGVMLTGWQKIGGKWYYLDKTGYMWTGKFLYNGKRYYLDESGAMQTGWQKIDGKWYYFNSDGILRTGWLKDDGKWYYFGENGVMLSNCSQKIGTKTYKFNKSGVCLNP